MFQKELMLMTQEHQKNVCFVINGIIKILVINFNQMLIINAIMKLKSIAIMNVKDVDYRCILLGISRNEAVNILNNSVLKDKNILSMVFNPTEISKG